MSNLSTSSSNGETAAGSPARWRRLRRDGLVVLGLVLLLELVFRLLPVQAALSPYTNLLWYDERLPLYAQILEDQPGYDLWLAGSSYMMTGLHPGWVQADIQAAGYPGFTVQNFGMNWMTDLEVMATVYDRWLLTLDQPGYVVLVISQRNMIESSAFEPPRILSSPMERMTILPANADDYIGAFFFANSALFRYGVVLRNTFSVPLAQAQVNAGDGWGGYVHTDSVLTCAPDFTWNAPRELPPSRLRHIPENLARIDTFLSVLAARQIGVLVVNFPQPACVLAEDYGGLAAYEQFYVGPVADHFAARGVPFVDLNARLNASVPPEEQQQYFYDPRHPNAAGAELLSAWTAEAVLEWLLAAPAAG